jgi:hypothetical protein
MNIREAARRCTRDDWTLGLTYLGWTFLGTLPLWGPILMLVAFSQPLSLEAVAGRGELALYSAAIVSGALHVVNKEVKLGSLLHRTSYHTPAAMEDRLQVRFPSGGILTLVSVGIIVYCAMVFGATAATAMTSGPMPGVVLSGCRVIWITLPVFIVSIGLGVLVRAVDKSSMGEMDLAMAWDEPLTKLEEKFEQTPSEG